jgi:nucleoside-diphosphate-sugar epimerase
MRRMVGDLLPATRAFVAGATGYTGRQVVRELRRQGIETFAHVRPDSSRLDRWRGEFARVGAAVDTTRWELGAMVATLRRLQPDLVFALLGTTRARARREGGGDYGAVDLGLTLLLLDAVKEAVPQARFLYLSAMGARPGTRNPYLAVRVTVEAALRDSRLSWVIARPAFVTGPDREESRPVERVASVSVDAALSIAGLFGGTRLQRRFASLDATTLARGLVRAASQPAREQLLEADAIRALAGPAGA